MNTAKLVDVRKMDFYCPFRPIVKAFISEALCVLFCYLSSFFALKLDAFNIKAVGYDVIKTWGKISAQENEGDESDLFLKSGLKAIGLEGDRVPITHETKSHLSDKLYRLIVVAFCRLF